MADYPSEVGNSRGGSGSGRGLLFYLRLGLLSITAMTLGAIVLALLAFGTMSSVLHKITAETMPTVDQANHLLAISGSIDSHARKLPNLHTPFALASTMYGLRGRVLELDAAIDRLDPSVVRHEAIAEVKAGLKTMNRQLDRLSNIVEQRCEIEGQQSEYARKLDELYNDMAIFGESMVLDPARPGQWVGLLAGMFRSLHLLVTSLATTEPDQVVSNQDEFEELTTRIRALLPDEPDRLRSRAMTILAKLESSLPFFDNRLHQLKLEIRTSNAVKGLAIMERVNQQIAAMSAELTHGAGDRAEAMNLTATRLSWGMYGFSALCFMGLYGVLMYSNRRIVRRLRDLQSGMLSHVEGNPLPINTSGTDEIADMAGSFMFYVDQANQRAGSLEERTRELNEALGALMEKTSILNTTMQSMHQGIIMVNKDMQVVSYNDNLAGLFGLDQQAVMGTPDFRELHRLLYLRTGQGEELLQQCLEKAKSRENLSFEQHIADDRTLEIHQKPLPGGGFVRTYTDITERKRAEEALRESERRLADIIEFLPDPTIVLDRQSRVAAWNQSMEDLTGLKKGDIVGKGDYEYALPFYGERRPLLADLVRVWNEDYAATYSSVTWKGDQLHMESFHPHMGNGGLYLSGTARALYDSSGNQVGAIESLRDVTDRRRVEERYETMAANVPGAIFQAKAGIGGELNFTYVSPGCLEHFDISPDDLVGGRRHLEMHPDDRAGFENAVQQSIRNLNQLEFVGRLVAPPDQRKWIRIVAKSSRDLNQDIVFNGLMLDVTKRKLAEAEYLTSERTLSAMSKAIEDALVMLDSQGRVRFWNPAAEKLFGYTAAEAQGLNLHEIVVPAELREKAHEGMKKFATTGEGHLLGANLEAEALNRSGQAFPVDLAISSFQVDGEWFAVGTARDITERKRAEAEMKQHVEDLERFNQLTIGREERMIQLKAEINKILEELGRGPKYRVVE